MQPPRSRRPAATGASRASGASGGHVARKRFGQHFLVEAAIVDGIVRAIDPRPGQLLVEIGPGLRALTQPLVERAGRLTVIEIDRDLVPGLRRHPGLDVVQADVLEVDFRALALCLGGADADTDAGATRGLRVVGNLPYNISTPILFHLMAHAAVIEDQHFMLQKEVVDRMVASPATAAYGRLSVMLQWRYAMEDVLFVPPESFDPPPKVDSAVVRMRPRDGVDTAQAERLSDVVRVAFSQRRKLLRHSLGPWLQARAFEGSFDLQRRAEEVPVDAYVTLARALEPPPAPS